MNDGKEELKILQFFIFKLNLTLKFKVNYPPNNRDLNQGVLLLWSKFGDSSLNPWQDIMRTSKWLPHTQTHRQTDAANDNTQRPKLASGNRVGQSREIYSNSVPLSPPHWPYSKRIRPPSWPRVAVASSIQNTKLFTWRTWPGAVPKCDWAARSQCGFKQRRADHTKYIWYVATHGQSVITTELMIAWIW